MRCQCCGAWTGAGWDDSAHSIVLGTGERRYFRRQEWDVITLLRDKAGRIVSHEQVMDRLYGHRADGGPDRYPANVLMSQIRRKLRGTAYQIRNQHNVGYVLQVCDAR